MSKIVRGALAAERRGVFVGSLASLAERYPEVAARTGSIVAAELAKSVKGDKFKSIPVFCNKQWCECPDKERGLAVYVPEGVSAGEKITIHVGGVGTRVDKHNCRNVIVVEEGASAFIEVRYAGGLCECGRLAEVWLGRGASLETVTFFEGEESEAVIEGTTIVRCDEDADYRSTVAASGVKSFADNTKVILAGKGARATVNGAAVGRGDSKIECNTIIEHASADTTSSQLFRAAAGDSSLVRFCGRIYVAPGADRIEAYQQNNNVLLSERARAVAEPRLEIYADDVKCSHGSTVGQLSEEALFYMRQRGISEEEARKLLVEGFIGEVFAMMGDAVLADRLADRMRL
ncbi:MAG: SufD family Fe-S cluster assembly protein [Rikenellaceae bacterium]|nr:SufD family Fe-S cluster assembly protein [Rikenellaceae bacterium]